MIALLPISGKRGAGRFVLIDAADLPALSDFSWHIAGLDGNDYPARTEWTGSRYIKVKLHRQLMGLTQGDGKQVDHINRDRFDARRSNLRLVTASEQQRNRRRWTVRATSTPDVA